MGGGGGGGVQGVLVTSSSLATPHPHRILRWPNTVLARAFADAI